VLVFGVVIKIVDGKGKTFPRHHQEKSEKVGKQGKKGCVMSVIGHECH
jgi:hypothetical protein